MCATAKAGETPEFAERFFSAAATFLKDLDQFFDEQRSEFEPELRELVDYALAHSGKRLRPISLYLTGAGAGGESNPEMVRAAAVVEMVHLATLVHDDILDRADIRHKQETVARKYGVSAAVLLGDALFAQALQLASGFETTEVCRLVSEATRKVCAGEIEQTLDGKAPDDDTQRYFRIIERKTAVLFEVSCRLGALLGAPGADLASSAGEFGRRIGIAYQMYDDMVDVLGTEQTIGKTLGTDFASGKRTLPFILLFEALDETEKKKISASFAAGTAESEGIELGRLIVEKGVASQMHDSFAQQVALAKAAARELKEFPGGEGLSDLA
ncbi:MAG: polyprenyl synthetase family protein, partial [Puniceicoccales bacterium]